MSTAESVAQLALLAQQCVNLDRENIQLSATLYGDPGSPAIMLVHGFPDTAHSWDRVVPHLVAAGYRVLVPWLRGYTPMSTNRQANYDLMAVADDIEAWQDHLGGGPVHLVGHDWGALAAIVAAKRGPARWRSLSLLAVPPVDARGMLRSVRHLPRQMVMSSHVLIMQAGFSPRMLGRHDAALVRRIWKIWSPDWRFDDAEFEPTRLVFTDRESAWAATRYYRSLFTMRRRATREFYRWIMAAPSTVPTLALAGANDGCMNVALHRALTAHAGVPAQQLPGCGHFLHAERPMDVAELLLVHVHATNESE